MPALFACLVKVPRLVRRSHYRSDGRANRRNCASGARRRDTVPAAFHYFSTTGEDSWGLQGTHGDNELHLNLLPFFELTTKVARRQRFSKKAG
jgi:hypothetical protein